MSKFSKLLILFFFLSLPILAQGQDSRAGDEAALQALYISTNGDNWTNNTGWNGGDVDLSNPPVHVVVEEVDGELRVRQINLHNSGGNVATSRAVWDDLQYLGGNNLTGEFPQEMSNLKKLTHLRVKENHMTGRIDHFVENLESAIRLSFSNADYRVSRREFLYTPEESSNFVAYNHEGKGQVSTNQFTGTIPDLDILSNLELFELSHGSISGTLPENLPTSIRVLAVQENEMTGTLPTWSNCVNFTHLYLKQEANSGSYTGAIPSEWNNFSEMRWFTIAGNDLTGSIPYLGAWYDLRQFNTGPNLGLSGDFPGWLFTETGKRENLHTWSIGGTYLGKSGISGELPQTIAKSGGSMAVTKLAGTDVGGALPLWVFEQNSRQYLIYDNNFTSIPSNAFEYIDRSKLLRINNNNISGNLPTGSIPVNVLAFNLSNNSFTGVIPADTWALENYEQNNSFYLNNNLLEGVIPVDFANAGSVGGGQIADLRLNDNKFTPKDILPHRSAIEASISGSFVYLPQKPFGQQSTVMAGNVIDKSSFHYSGNRYQWYKDGSPVSGETSHSINTSSYGIGTYVLEIIHPEIDFVFQSEPVEVSVDGDDDSTDEPTAPPAPSLQSPATGAGNISVRPEFSWSSVSAADSYTLRVYTSGGSLVFENSSTGTSYHTPSSRSLDFGTEYSWSVRATRDGLNSEWSSTRSFTTESDDDGSGGNDGGGTGDGLSAPALLSPTDGATDVSVTPSLEWSNLEADYYILHVSASNPSEMVIEETVEGTSFTSGTPLLEDRNHQWRVRGVKDGVEGEWSSIANFTTENISGGNGNNGKGPQKSTPAKDEKKVNKKATFKWESVEGAESYTIEVREASTSALFIGEEVTDTVFVSTSEMKGNTDYVWRVRASVQGQAGEWSDEWQFTTEDENEETAFEVELSQNYPNPFNPSTNIRFTIAEQQEVSLKVYDMAGRLVASLINGSTLSAGTHSANFNAQSLASGIYFYRLITPSEIVTRKMTLMK